MNQNAPQPSFELPSLPNEGSVSPPSPEEVPQFSPERSTNLAAPVAQPQSTQPTMPTAPVPQADLVDPVTPVQSSATPLLADDADLIEKEWVIKAKQIVAATKEDPYTQTREMSKFKADYLKKRYNKDLKVEES